MDISAPGSAGRLMQALFTLFDQEADKLNALDAQLGDGDHGLSMRTGLQGVLELAQDKPDLPLDAFLREGGSAFNEAAGSTIGILMMSAMKAAGAAAAGKDRLGLADAAAMLDAATQAIMTRGKAKPGQKTILDSLAPAVEALKACAARSASASEAAHAAAEAARIGAEATAELTSSTGRSKWFKERSVGIMDPGAWSGYLLIRTIGETLAEDGQ